MAENALHTSESAPRPSGLKGDRRWLRLLLIWAAALLLIGLIGCVVLYRYLAVYEISRPELLMDELMTTVSREDFLDAARQNLDFTVSEFEDAEALYESYAASLPRDGGLSYVSLKGRSTPDLAVFTVRSGPANVCSVELIPGDSGYAFGRHDWRLGRIGTGDITEQLSSVTVRVSALNGDEICINGVPVSDAHISKANVKIPDLSQLEKRFDETPHYVEYTVGPLYGDIVLTDGDGGELFPTEESGDTTLIYDARPAGRHSLHITAPADVTVTVGGAKLGAKDVSSSGLGGLAGLDNYTDGRAYETRSYEFDGLISVPEVSAEDRSGRALTPIVAGDGRYAFFYANESAVQEELQEAAERYFDLYLHYTLSPFDMTYFYNLLQSTLWGTDLYNYIAQSQQAMLWAPNTSPEYRYLNFDHFHMVGENCFVCTVEYDIDMTASTWKEEEISYSLQNAYELVFIREGRSWFAASMTAIAN